ncbi:universal stress protein [Nereida sp. MMG025]|uniref:universal stress protein n=1 Tax=Nereida sp. MMG025 TaxID=2909981 RepID=UPI001F48F082|nr:universal stress protein [Nereida sp. MMG025]MCF6444474.1 universal stress protein [Nereida sp. MMG025]
MAELEKIVALVDGSVYSESVCDHAAWVAEKIGGHVVVAHVIGRREAKADLSGNIGLGARSKLMEELSALDEERAKLNHKRGRAILEDAEARIAEKGVSVSTVLRQGDLVQELGKLAEDAELVIVGKRGEAADFATMHLGSNLERVVRSCTKPILVTSRAYQPIEDFLIAFDGGKSSLRAVDHVARAKLFKGLEAKVVTAGTDTAEVRQKLDGAAAMLKGAGLTVTTEIAEGQAENAIADRIGDGAADMLVMGAYGHSRIRSLIIGSTTTQMIRSCQVPLLLFR